MQVYGFIDFTTLAALNEDGKNLAGRYLNAYIGSLNIYFAKRISESVRTMAEIRFLYLPNGTPTDVTTGARFNGTAEDYAMYARPLNWGGIEIERVYLEWSIVPQLSLRIGQFLTPYGIWNVDHGSPTVISVNRPFVIGNDIFPERQTGLELFGSVPLGTDTTLGYHATLSNGRGPISDYYEMDTNKALGGRAYLEFRHFGQLRIGGSVYYGTYSDVADSPILEETINDRYDDLAFAGISSGYIKDSSCKPRACTGNGRTTTTVAVCISTQAWAAPCKSKTTSASACTGSWDIAYLASM